MAHLTATPASSSLPSASPNYHVFISHSGLDVKKTFASYLYHRLLSHGLRVFLDQQELTRGDDFPSQIESVIRTASLHIAIFSGRYAESKWCLDELLLMLESRAPVVPVFYHVDPSELRWTRGKDGVYARALRNLEMKTTHDSQSAQEKPRFESSTVENWRNALSRAADISGFELKACNGDEGELLEKVVHCVLEKVKKPRFNVAEYPTGLDEKLKDFEDTVALMQRPTEKPQVVGIVGLGGIGKTTLCQEFFNRKSSNYHRSYFLCDVRKKASTSSLHFLQSKLIKGLIERDDPIESVNEGIEKLQGHLEGSHALLILDDVDHVDQLAALLRPVQTVLRSDSLILITSRNKDVLTSSKVEESFIYEVTGLNTQHSTKLFCLHAFGQSYPLPGFENLVDKFLDACGKLPLSLKVLGAHLCGKTDQSYWQDQLDRLKRILPEEIQQTLKISYDSLSKEEKEIFLDIACFFIGENRDMAIRIWDGSGWNGLQGFRNLQSKCLVGVISQNLIGADTPNFIQMHDQLRDLGREIAKASGSPRRLPAENMVDLLQQSHNHEQVITEVRGIQMAHSEYNDEWAYTFLRSDMSRYRRRGHELFGNIEMKFRNTFHRGVDMRRLQLLDIEDGLLKCVLKRVQSVPDLIWLRWRRCPYSSLPSWIPMKNLRVLNVVGSNLESMWKAESQVPLQLRELQIYAPISNFPKSIGQLKFLERIVVSCGGPSGVESNLKELPEEFCQLQSLEVLVLNSSELKSLPKSFGYLTNLQHIDLSHSISLERLPESFEGLIRLKILLLKYCPNITISRETLVNIGSLEYMNFSGSEKIEELPEQVLRHQRSLKQLGAFPNPIGDPSPETMPPWLSRLRNLKELKVENGQQLKWFTEHVELMTQLVNLTIVDCPLRKLPFKRVEGEPRETLTESRGSVCPNLERLIIKDCNDLVEVGKLPNTLIELVFESCHNLRKIEGLSGLAQLQKMIIKGCLEMKKLPGIETLVSLEELQVSECGQLKSIWGLAQLRKLRKLWIVYCSGIEVLPSIETLVSLEELQVSACSQLKSIRGLAQLTKLQKLVIMFCSEIEELPSIETLVSLEELEVQGCSKLKRIRGLAQLTKLQKVSLKQ